MKIASSTSLSPKVNSKNNEFSPLTASNTFNIYRHHPIHPFAHQYTLCLSLSSFFAIQTNAEPKLIDPNMTSYFFFNFFFLTRLSVRRFGIFFIVVSLWLLFVGVAFQSLLLCFWVGYEFMVFVCEQTRGTEKSFQFVSCIPCCAVCTYNAKDDSHSCTTYTFNANEDFNCLSFSLHTFAGFLIISAASVCEQRGKSNF